MLPRAFFTGAKCAKNMKKIINSKGQISLFFATTLFVLLSFLAFIINIGIFVKVKINLQNATDAAAYAGASVQARQLTNISYLNWEMRNTYKEWLFKYYVLGNLNIKDVEGSASGSNVKFNMSSYNTNSSNPAKDRYNIPSVCIDFAGQGTTALCKNYIIPGLPRFNPLNYGSLDQTTNSILDTLTDQKNIDCALRSKVNFLTTTLWAYNVTAADDQPNALQTIAPEIGSKNSGAFPKAIELALRMRSLEAQVNKAPYTTGVCSNPGGGVACSLSINSIQNNRVAADERISKAYFSGLRNLGGSGESDELRSSFTLREIPPKEVYEDNIYSTSNLLIPDGSKAAVAKKKYYLDLKLMTVNLATFYTIFASLKDNTTIGGEVIKTEAACAATKAGLPVPGYPLGFVKNPDVLTYYAVEGKAKFVGMFNPFDDEDGIKISAYAAAKPFGGRIGPMLMDVSSKSEIKARVSNGSKKISSAFLTGMKSTNFVDKNGDALAPGVYAPGAPLPIDPPGSNFWQSSDSAVVGGWADDPNKIVFAVPNLVYDYPGDSIESNDYFDGQNIAVLNPSDTSQELQSGLYNADMFEKFKKNLGPINAAIDTERIRKGILKVRAPTKWEANNYLIPTTESINQDLALDSFGFIAKGVSPEAVDDSHKSYEMQIYAPLFGQDALLDNAGQVKNVMNIYLKNQKPAILKYLKSMNSASASIYKDNSSGATANDLGKNAADLISDIPLSSMQGDPFGPNAIPTCKSIAGKFMFFYYGLQAQSEGLVRDLTGCTPPGVTPEDSYLSGMMEKYFSSSSLLNPSFHLTKLTLPNGKNENLFTAYHPIEQNDASLKGVWQNRLRGKSENMNRNFYSAKFIPLKSLSQGSSRNFVESSAGIPIFSDGNPSAGTNSDTKQQSFKNPLDFGQLNLNIGDLNH